MLERMSAAQDGEDEAARTIGIVAMQSQDRAAAHGWHTIVVPAGALSGHGYCATAAGGLRRAR